MHKKYTTHILDFFERYFDSVYQLQNKKIIQYANLGLSQQVKLDDDNLQTNETLDWYVNISHQEASIEKNFEDWFMRQFLYSYSDTIVMNVNQRFLKTHILIMFVFIKSQNLYFYINSFKTLKKVRKQNLINMKIQSYRQNYKYSFIQINLIERQQTQINILFNCMQQQSFMLEYRRANRLLYDLQKKVEGKNKDIFIMCKDLDIQKIANIEFLKTEYTNKYLCIKQALVNDTFEQINDDTEQFMRNNNVKLLPLKYVSSYGITERLLSTKKYKTMFFEDDSINSKFTDIKYPRQYLPDILYLSVCSTDKENYAIESDVHLDESGMKYFTLEKRQKGARHDFEQKLKDIESKEYEEFDLNKRAQTGINMLKNERRKTRRKE